MEWVLAFLLGGALGAGVAVYWARAQQRKRRRVPQQWPLKLRPLVNTREHKVWDWLCKAMFDHQVQIKLPLTRITTPTQPGDAAHWYHLLNGVYCSFTVCDAAGHALACVDVLSPQGPSMSNRTLKHRLLRQVGVHYLLVDSDNLPHMIKIRTLFLGDDHARGHAPQGLEARLRDMRNQLQATVDRQRNVNGPASAGPDSLLPSSSQFPESDSAQAWEQNSFVVPLDSRAAPLR